MYKKLIAISIAALVTTFAFAANNNNDLKYTKENPLVYEDVWDLPPFSFMNEEGQPDGFNISLVKEIMKRLNVPYVIKLKHTPLNFQDVSSGKAALTIGMKAPYHNEYGKYGNTALMLFTHSIAIPKNKQTGIHNFEDLKNYKVYVHRGSFSHNQMVDAGMAENAIPVDDMNSVLTQVAKQDSGIVFWNTNTLKELISRNNIDNIRLTSISMKYGEYYFMSRDSLLLHKLDSVYDEMVANDEVMPFRKKWFYPEMNDNTADTFTTYALWAWSFFFAILIAYNIYYKLQKRRLNESNEKQLKRLGLLLKSGKLDLWTYNTSTKTFRIINPTNNINEEFSMKMFSLFFSHSDFKHINEEIENIELGICKTAKLLVRSDLNRNTENDEMSYFDLNISILQEEGGVPTMIIGVMKNVTTERKKFIDTNNNLLKYRTIFNSSMADLAFYDKNGILTDINHSACVTFGIEDREALIKSNTHISEIPIFMGLDGDFSEGIHVSSITDMDKLHTEKESTLLWTRTGIIYYEFTIVPIYDAQGELLCVVSCGKDITEMAKRMKKERLRLMRIKNTSGQVEDYVKNINYALEMSGTRLANYYTDTHEMTLSNNVNKPMRNLSQMRCLSLVDQKYKQQTESLFIKLDKKAVKSFKLRVGTIFRGKYKNDAYYEFNGIPIKNGNETSHYFCLCRNVSQLVETEKQLQEETKKAQEAEAFQNSFLKNMSHEIRTPLYTVVGFAELFQGEHDKEDEQVFIDQIKKNSDMLLKLVNNILLLSRIDAKMVDVTTSPVDFPEFFKAKCLMGWTQGVAPGVETKIETGDEHLMLEIDDNHTGLIIETLCRLASMFTKQGIIHTRYIYHSGQIIMMFKDTGVGMDEKKKAEIKNRNLDTESGDYNTLIQLVICQQLSILMGGTMDFEGETGEGSTFWVTLPCKQIDAKDKQNVETTQTSDMVLENNLLNTDNLSEEDINNLLANSNLFK